MNAGGTLVEFFKILHLMDRLFWLDDARMRGIHLVGIGGNELAGAVRSIACIHMKILNAETANGSRHPAILVAMIVDAAELADFPADGEHFEKLALENQIPGVMALRVEEIRRKRFRLNGKLLSEIENARNSEFRFGIAESCLIQLSIVTISIGAPPRESKPEFQTFYYISARRIEWRKIALGGRDIIECKMSSSTHTSGAAANLLGKSVEELREFLQTLGEPAYRGAQIYHALYAERRFDLAAMSNLAGSAARTAGARGVDRVATDCAAT